MPQVSGLTRVRVSDTFNVSIYRCIQTNYIVRVHKTSMYDSTCPLDAAIDTQDCFFRSSLLTLLSRRCTSLSETLNTRGSVTARRTRQKTLRIHIQRPSKCAFENYWNCVTSWTFGRRATISALFRSYRGVAEILIDAYWPIWWPNIREKTRNEARAAENLSALARWTGRG